MARVNINDIKTCMRYGYCFLGKRDLNMQCGIYAVLSGRYLCGV